MTTRLRLWIDSPLTQTELGNRVSDTSRYVNQEKVIDYLRGLMAGTEAASVDMLVGVGSGTAASGTLTISANTAQSVTINGKTLTGGTDYVIATLSVTQIAANIVAAIAASTDSRLKAVSATSALGVVTVTAREPGAIGNIQTLAATGAGAAGAATLAGGVDAAITKFNFNV